MLDRATTTQSELIASRSESQAEELLTCANRYRENLQELDAKLESINVYKSTNITLTAEQVFSSCDKFRDLVYLYIDRIEVDDSTDEIKIIFNT